MIGIELERACATLVNAALERGLLINVTAGNVVRLLPPLIIDETTCDKLVSGLSALISDFLSTEAA